MPIRSTFFIARVKGGAVSPRLCNLKAGESILLDTEMNGMLIESRLQPGGRDLWLLSTGTGVAPFVAIVSDESIMDKYERVFLVHGVRNWNETQYLQHVLKLQPKLRVMASVTRDAGALIDVRIPDALESGLLEATAEAEIMSVLQLFPGENQPLLIGRNPFFLLYLDLYVIDRVFRLYLERDGLACERFY